MVYIPRWKRLQRINWHGPNFKTCINKNLRCTPSLSANLDDTLDVLNQSLHVATPFYTLALPLPFLLLVLHAFIMDVALFSFFQHGTRHIIESLNKAGHHINTLFLCGGLTKNELFIQTQADVTGQFH